MKSYNNRGGGGWGVFYLWLSKLSTNEKTLPYLAKDRERAKTHEVTYMARISNGEISANV